MRRLLSLAALSMLALSASAGAQRASSNYSPSPEIGMDAALDFRLTSPSVTTFALPVPQVRMGFFVSPALSIEPTLGLFTFSGGGVSGTTYRVGAGVLYHFSPSRAANQFYVRPFISIDGNSGDAAVVGATGSSVTFGVGGGIKMPLRDRIASRFEANFAHNGGRNGGGSSDMLGLRAGLSVYTR